MRTNRYQTAFICENVQSMEIYLIDTVFMWVKHNISLSSIEIEYVIFLWIHSNSQKKVFEIIILKCNIK